MQKLGPNRNQHLLLFSCRLCDNNSRDSVVYRGTNPMILPFHSFRIVNPFSSGLVAGVFKAAWQTKMDKNKTERSYTVILFPQ